MSLCHYCRRVAWKLIFGTPMCADCARKIFK